MDVQRGRGARLIITRRLGAIAVLAACLASSAPRAFAPVDDTFDQLYERGQRVNASIRTLTAAFTETTRSALLEQPIVARGTLAVERPSRVVLHYTHPDLRTVLIDNNRMTMTWPSRQTMDIGSAMGRVEKLFVNGSAKELRQQFDVDDSQPTDRPGTVHVLMTPKQRRIREGLTRLDLWVDRQTSLLSAMQMTFPNGDSKLMTFTSVVQNPTLAAGVFALDR